MNKIKRFGIEVQDSGQVLVVIEHMNQSVIRETLSGEEATILMAAIESGVSPLLRIRSSMARIRSLIEGIA